jgi:hypothetical protein
MIGIHLHTAVAWITLWIALNVVVAVIAACLRRWGEVDPDMQGLWKTNRIVSKRVMAFGRVPSATRPPDLSGRRIRSCSAAMDETEAARTSSRYPGCSRSVLCIGRRSRCLRTVRCRRSWP